MNHSSETAPSCPACGASPSTPGRTQRDVALLPTDEVAAWLATAESIARTLTLVREALGDPPEDLPEVLSEIENHAWELATRFSELAGEE